MRFAKTDLLESFDRQGRSYLVALLGAEAATQKSLGIVPSAFFPWPKIGGTGFGVRLSLRAFSGRPEIGGNGQGLSEDLIDPTACSMFVLMEKP
jgi:hypothetical protein